MTNVIKLRDITLPGSGYPKLINFLDVNLPVTAGLSGLYVFGGDEAKSLRNHANPALPLVKVGSPVINTVGATTSRFNCFGTGISGTAGVTFFAIAKLKLFATPSAGHLMISNFGNPVDGDTLGLQSNSLTVYGEGPDGTVNGVSVSLTSGVVDSWAIFAGRVKATGEEQSWWVNQAGAIVAATESGPSPRGSSTSTFRIGGHYGTGFSGVNDMALASIFSAALSDEDVAANLQYLRDEILPMLS